MDLVVYFFVMAGYIIGFFMSWKIGKKVGKLEERAENAEKRFDDVSNALAVRSNADIDELRKRYKISNK